MKITRILLVAISCMLTSVLALAQGTNLELRLSDGNPLKVTINDRVFPKISDRIMVGNIPAGESYIEVTRLCTDNEGRKCRNKIVFGGYVQLRENTKYQALVNVADRTLRVSDLLNLYEPGGESATPSINQAIDTTAEFLQTIKIKQQLSQQMDALLLSMKSLPGDKEKQAKVNAFFTKNSYTTDDVYAAATALLFDDSRLQLCKDSYAGVSNKHNYSALIKVFTLQKTADSFNAWLAAQ